MEWDERADGECRWDTDKVLDDMDQLLKDNAALRAEVERLREERRWRDADKEWPAGTEWCLCRWREPTELMCLWFDGHGDWKDFDGEVQYPMYWLPLPAPPAKEE